MALLTEQQTVILSSDKEKTSSKMKGKNEEKQQVKDSCSRAEWTEVAVIKQDICRSLKCLKSFAFRFLRSASCAFEGSF